MGRVQEKRLKFVYDGEQHSIDVNTFVASQMHISAILSEIQKIHFPDHDIKVRIGAFSEGSFETDLILQLPVLSHLLSSTVSLQPIVTTFSGLITIWKALKGKRAGKVLRDGGNVIITIEGDNNQVVISPEAYDLYKGNPVVGGAINSNFSLLENDESIDGIEVVDLETERVIVEVERGDFDSLTAPNQYFDSETKTEADIDAILTIKKLDFFTRNRRTKWEFFYQGRTIKATMASPNFFKKIDEGLRLGKGDRLVASLSKTLKYNEEYNLFEEKGYEVTAVSRVIPREDPGNLFE